MIYLFLPDPKKTQWLLHEVRRDVVFAQVVDDLEAFGFKITHSFWEGNGVYQPYLLNFQGNDFEEEFMKQHAQGAFKAQFRLGTRHGAGAALFHFLHELVHFKQDLDGRILEPASILEEEAAHESTAAAYRLKEAGYPQAWSGAIGSLNWRAAAKAYERGKKKPSSLLQSKQGNAKTPPAIWKFIINHTNTEEKNARVMISR